MPGKTEIYLTIFFRSRVKQSGATLTHRHHRGTVRRKREATAESTATDEKPLKSGKAARPSSPPIAIQRAAIAAEDGQPADQPSMEVESLIETLFEVERDDDESTRSVNDNNEDEEENTQHGGQGLSVSVSVGQVPSMSTLSTLSILEKNSLRQCIELRHMVRIIYAVPNNQAALFR